MGAGCPPNENEDTCSVFLLLVCDCKGRVSLIRRAQEDLQLHAGLQLGGLAWCGSFLFRMTRSVELLQARCIFRVWQLERSELFCVKLYY